MHAAIGFTINIKSYLFTKFSTFLNQYQARLYLFQCISHGDSKYSHQIQDFLDILWRFVLSSAHACRMERVNTYCVHLYFLLETMERDVMGYEDHAKFYIAYNKFVKRFVCQFVWPIFVVKEVRTRLLFRLCELSMLPKTCVIDKNTILAIKCISDHIIPLSESKVMLVFVKVVKISVVFYHSKRMQQYWILMLKLAYSFWPLFDKSGIAVDTDHQMIWTGMHLEANKMSFSWKMTWFVISFVMFLYVVFIDTVIMSIKVVVLFWHKTVVNSIISHSV